MIIWWLFDDYLWLFELPNRDVRPYSGVCDYLMIICNYWSYLITNNYQIMLSLFDDYFIIIFTQIIPIIQTIKAKYEYLVPFWQIIFTSQQSLFDDYLMIIWWLFDDDYHNYLHYVNYLIHRKITSIQKCKKGLATHPFSLSPGYAASRYLWSGLHDWQRLPLICLIPHCRASPVFLDVGDEYCTHARTRTRHYSLCICNSRIALSAGFAFDLFGGASETSASAMHQNEHAGCHSLRLL